MLTAIMHLLDQGDISEDKKSLLLKIELGNFLKSVTHTTKYKYKYTTTQLQIPINTNRNIFQPFCLTSCSPRWCRASLHFASLHGQTNPIDVLILLILFIYFDLYFFSFFLGQNCCFFYLIYLILILFF